MPDDNQPQPEKPLFLLRGSPLVSGGKARLLSGGKVKPRRAKPREVSGPEAHGYTSEPTKALPREPECLTEDDWKRHVHNRSQTTEQQRRTLEEIARDRDRRLLSQEERIVKAQAEASALNRNVSREVWLLRVMQSQGKRPAQIEKRVQVLERIAYLGRDAA